MPASTRGPEDGCWPVGPGPLARPLEVHGQGGTCVGAMGLKLARTPHHPNRSRPARAPHASLGTPYMLNEVHKMNGVRKGVLCRV